MAFRRKKPKRRLPWRVASLTSDELAREKAGAKKETPTPAPPKKPETWAQHLAERMVTK